MKDTQVFIPPSPEQSQSKFSANAASYKAEPVHVFSFDISHLSGKVQFVILAAFVFGFYLVYGYLQEWIFRQDGMKPHGWYLTLVQFAFYALFSKLELWYHGEHRHIPLSTYVFLALTTLTTMGFSNASLGYLNYPTQVIFKCCKLIPVLLGGIVIQGKRYGPVDVLAASTMCVGLILFTLADSKVSPNFNWTGIVMISIALLADAVIGNVQEKTMKQYHASNAEVIFYSYGLGFVYLAVGLVISSNFVDSAVYFSENAMLKYGSTFLFSLSGYLGMQVVLSLVRTFGALVTVTVTSFRKALSIVISFLVFSKPFTMQYVYSGCLVLVAIYLNLLAKRLRDRDLRQLVVAGLARLQQAFAQHGNAKPKTIATV